jgi:hypothetical protein
VRAYRAWHIVTPRGGILRHTLRVVREHAIRDFASVGARDTRAEWRHAWRQHYRAGFRCEPARVSTL